MRDMRSVSERVRTGLEVLLHERLDRLRGRRVGLVTHPAAVLPDFIGAAGALLPAGVRLTALFGPEHGLDGAAVAGDGVANTVDARTGLPVWSLYGPTQEPAPAMLDGVDLLVFDMQDVGVRFYTYLSTLFYVLPHFSTTLLYPGLCLLEGTNTSTGCSAAAMSAQRWKRARRLMPL